jgi:hypothetical protein
MRLCLSLLPVLGLLCCCAVVVLADTEIRNFHIPQHGPASDAIDTMANPNLSYVHLDRAVASLCKSHG